MKPDSVERASEHQLGLASRALAGIVGLAFLLAAIGGLPLAIWLALGDTDHRNWLVIVGIAGLTVSGAVFGRVFLKAARSGVSPPWNYFD
jgi:apolipoprotein N-acyltransferase